MQPIDLSSLHSLSVDERLTLVEAIWDSIDGQTEQIPLTDEQREELDLRIAEMNANPGAGENWDVVLERLRHRK